MYKSLQSGVFDGILTAALGEYVAEEFAEAPSDEELAKKYPVSKRKLRYYIRKLKERNYRMPLALVYLRRAAVVVLALISVSFATLMTSEGVRDATKNSVVEWYDRYIDIDFKRLPSEEQTTAEDTAPLPETEAVTADDLTVGYIPEGFIRSGGDAPQGSGNREYIYMSEDGSYFLIGIYDTDKSSIGVDIENSEYEELTVNGNHAFLAYDTAESFGSLVFGNDEYTVSISGMLEKDELVNIAQSIK